MAANSGLTTTISGVRIKTYRGSSRQGENNALEFTVPISQSYFDRLLIEL
jgi:hypothetical protein